MAITVVGTPQAATANNGGNATINFDVAPQTDDVVYLIANGGDQGTAASFAVGTAGYTELLREVTAVPWTIVARKRMGATPDTSVTVNGNGSGQNAMAVVAIVLRGVDTTTAEDATTQANGPSAGATPDPPSITTVTNGAWIVAMGAENGSDTTVGNPPTGYSNGVEAHAVDTRRANVALATKEVATAGAEDPGTWDGWSSTASSRGITVAVRPAGAGAQEGSATGSISWSGSATGAAVHEGAGSGSVTWAGSATGSVVHEGSASGSITWAGSATGEAPPDVNDGSATGAITWAGTATGQATHRGSASGSITWAGSADGATVHEGSSTGSISWAGAATGAAVHQGTGTGSITWAGSATGESPAEGVNEGSATGSITWTGTATGQTVHQGSAAGAIAWAGAVTGVTVHEGSATGAISWVGAATGRQPSDVVFRVEHDSRIGDQVVSAPGILGLVETAGAVSSHVEGA